MSASVEGFLSCLNLLADNAVGYRKTAFQKAIKSLQTFQGATPGRITYEEGKKLPGFGDGIRRRLQEYIDCKSLSELKGVEEKVRTLKLFEGVFGVGPVIAARWFELGYRQLSDVPQDSLTENQKLGIRYYADINAKIPRAEIAEIEQRFLTQTRRFNLEHKCDLRFQICGSYLRGRPVSGDIDLIITEPSGKLHSVISEYIAFLSPLVEHILSSGKSKILTIGGLGKIRRRIDFELVEPTQWPFALLYFTGSKEFNKHMRFIANEKGYTLNEKELTDGKIKIQVSTEEEIFEFLGMKYLTPQERDKF